MRVKYLVGAEQDIAEAVEWYAERSEPAAVNFEVELTAAIQRAVNQPSLYAADADGNRFCRLDRYPFRLVFRVEADFLIVAVAHDSRQPAFWQDR